MIIHPQDRSARAGIPLSTKRGTAIPNAQRLERPHSALAAGVALWGTERPQARLRSVTSTYNCVALVLACRRTWVDTEEISLVLTEDGFRRLAGVGEAQRADLELYRDAQGDLAHIGLVISNTPDIETAGWDTMVLSKWGWDGEYYHPVDHVPQIYGRPAEYWSERQWS